MTVAIEAVGLGKRYRRRSALSDCTLSIPTGRVVGLVGPNGAGKTTLMHLAVGLLAPSAGTIEVLGAPPSPDPAWLARFGFLAQDSPTYARLTVEQHLQMGAWLNPGWDAEFARMRVAQLGLDAAQRAGTLSGGQRAQLALTLAVAKRPELLVLDEPVASLDPLARRDFLQAISDVATEQGASVILSSHLVADLERICDFVIVLVASQVRVAGTIEHLLATHHRLTGPPDQDLPDGEVIEARHTGEATTALVRSAGTAAPTGWTVEPVTLEDV